MPNPLVRYIIPMPEKPENVLTLYFTEGGVQQFVTYLTVSEVRSRVRNPDSEGWVQFDCHIPQVRTPIKADFLAISIRGFYVGEYVQKNIQPPGPPKGHIIGAH